MLRGIDAQGQVRCLYGEAIDLRCLGELTIHRSSHVEELTAKAEALRGLLQDASAHAGRLLAALKQQRRQSQAVRQAMQSLRRLEHRSG